MYIKKVTTHNGKTKKRYEYLHLVESVRTSTGPRQRLILSLGKLDVHPSQYKALAQRIEDILTGQKSFVEVDSKIEKYAQTISKKLFHKRAQEEEEKRPPDYQTVDESSLQIETPCTLGPEYVCHSVWEELGLPDFFREQGLSERVQPLIEALVIGRMVDPGSERYTKEWAEKRSALYELCGFPVHHSLNSYYRAGDHLYSVKEALEQHLAITERNLFSLSEKMVLLDLTNTFFEGRAEKNPKAKRGHSKEKRSDCKLVTLGLLLDENGFAKYSQLFPGNQSEPTAMRQMITALEKQIGPHQKDRTVVMDQGISTKENIQWLKERGYHYITVHRGSPPVKVDYDDFEVIREDSSKGVKIEVKRFPKEDELFVLCRSAQKTVTEKGIRKRVEDLFIERLTHYKEGLALRGRMKKYSLILQKIGRLKEKYPRASSLYDVEVIPESGKKAEDASLLAVDIIWKQKKEKYPEEIQAEGTYLLKTDRLDLENKEIWETYRMLNHVESSFRSIKSYTGLRPNFHQVEQRVDTHMFISVVAYHLLHAVEYRLKALGEHRCWKTICNVLKTHERMTLSYSYQDSQGQNKKQFLRLSSTVEAEHRKIYGLLNLSGVALPRKKMNQLRE